ncbi:MAG: hypothetical protein ABJF86_15795 [Tateyamaria sp.]|uniref:hypothetical protein n=1 Tax=Tateyamaria sp. TaxID=1929288 RepID=UPI00327C3415
MSRFVASGVLFALGCLAQIWVAADPVIHVLVQMPLLAAAGYVLPRRFILPRSGVGPVLILAFVALTIWMLPRSVDAALSSYTWHLAKFVTIPLGIGFALSLSWPCIGPVLRGFIKAQLVSMLLFLGFLYTHAPIRICNSYLIDDQHRLGLGFAYVAIGLALYWIVPVFIGPPTSAQKGNTHDIRGHGYRLF